MSKVIRVNMAFHSIFFQQISKNVRCSAGLAQDAKSYKGTKLWKGLCLTTLSCSYEERRKGAMKTMETTSSWLRFQGHRILSHANATLRFCSVLLLWCLVSFSLIVVFYNGQIIQLFTTHFHSIYFLKKFTKTSVIVINGKESPEYLVTLDSKHELLPIMLLSLFFFFFYTHAHLIERNKYDQRVYNSCSLIKVDLTIQEIGKSSNFVIYLLYLCVF